MYLRRLSLTLSRLVTSPSLTSLHWILNASGAEKEFVRLQVLGELTRFSASIVEYLDKQGRMPNHVIH